MKLAQVKPCPECEGKGGHERLDRNGDFFETCHGCGGWGKVEVPTLREAIHDARMKPIRDKISANQKRQLPERYK